MSAIRWRGPVEEEEREMEGRETAALINESYQVCLTDFAQSFGLQ